MSQVCDRSPERPNGERFPHPRWAQPASVLVVRHAVGAALLTALSMFTICACRDSGRAHAPLQKSAGEAEQRAAAAVDEADAGEAREEEEERAQRRQAMASLTAYRAPSCDAAMARIKELLQRGQGRWHERTDTGALPDDLLAVLSQAELWRNQSGVLCTEEPQRQRFNELQLLMDSLWRYPSTVARAELDRRLSVLNER